MEDGSMKRKVRLTHDEVGIAVSPIYRCLLREVWNMELAVRTLVNFPKPF